MNNHTRGICLVALALAGVLFSSCNRAKTLAPKRYPFTGRVVSIDTQAPSAIIDGDAIPGFMEAMTMPYKVKPVATLNHLIPGDSISAEVVVVRDADSEVPPDYWLENVKALRHIDPTPAAGANSLHMPTPGENVPDFSFTNQSGKRISLKHYGDKVLLVTFIYTRCPFPDFCPRMSSNFAEIYKQLGTNPSLSRAHLLSISFDPDHDTPKVLRDYGFAVAHTHDPALFTRWEFAAPTASDLPKIAAFFALTVKPEGGLITHNLSTAVIGPDGEIIKWYHGGDWQVSDLINDVGTTPDLKQPGTGGDVKSTGKTGKGTTSEAAEKPITRTTVEERPFQGRERYLESVWASAPVVDCSLIGQVFPRPLQPWSKTSGKHSRFSA